MRCLHRYDVRIQRAPSDGDPISWSIGHISGGGAREDINFAHPATTTRLNRAWRREWSDQWGDPLRISDEVWSRWRTELFPHRNGVQCTGRTGFSPVVLTVEIDVDYTIKQCWNWYFWYIETRCWDDCNYIVYIYFVYFYHLVATENIVQFQRLICWVANEVLKWLQLTD
jgi:hypothetical protein